jgi:hypothetical protein
MVSSIPVRYLRSFRHAVAWLTLLICVAYVSLYLYGQIQIRRAQTLVDRVAAIPIGQQLSGNARAYFSQHYCDPNGRCRRLKIVSNAPFATKFLWSGLQRGIRLPRLLPANWWDVGVEIEEDQQGRVLNKWLFANDGRYGQYDTLEVHVNFKFRSSVYRVFDPCLSPSQVRHAGYRPLREMRTGALFIDLAIDTSPDFVERALRLDLSCLNTFRGCKSPAEIAPSAWHDQEQDETVRRQDIDLRNVSMSCGPLSAR